jgi:hypothetical protein|nr:MAG TPA: hypothetical protein [Caudoviricetes sp.]
MSSFDYLVEDLEAVANEAPAQDSLQRLNTLVNKYKEQQETIERLEEQLSQAKTAFFKTAKEDIPNLLMQNGLSEIKLPSGEKVSVKMEVAPTITNMEEFAQFLTERGDGSILKTQMELGKLDPSIVNSIRKMLVEKLDLYPDIKQTVHPMTLKKYIKELCLLNDSNPTFDENDDTHIPLQNLPKCVSAFTFYNTSIKRSK